LILQTKRSRGVVGIHHKDERKQADLLESTRGVSICVVSERLGVGWVQGIF